LAGVTLIPRKESADLYPMVDSPTSSSDMRACGAALARFHQASTKNYHLRNHSANMVGKWPADFREKHIFLSKQAEKVFLKKQVGEILKYSKQTLKSLKKHNYQKVCRAHPKRSVLCHGDGGPTNFIINKKGIHLIDFETLRIDLRAYDLYRMIYNSCKDHGWKFEIAKNILEGYQSISKLKKVDFRMISVLLRFPQTTYLLFRSLRHQKNHRKSVAIQALQAERKVSAFIKKLDRFSRK